MNLTFDEWKAKGYHVIKGEKATGRNDKGKATFTQKQVCHNHSYGDDDGDPEDDYNQWYDTYGYDRDWV